MTLIQIDGLSGTGKTTLSEELVRRGYKAIDADAEFAYFADPETGLPTDDQRRSNWKWDGEKLNAFAEEAQDDTVFVCGGALNGDDFRHLFAKHFTLYVDDDTMHHRLLTRTNHDFGKDPEELEEQLSLNKTATRDAQAIGSIVIDSTQPISKVADEIIRQALGSTTSRQIRFYIGTSSLIP